MIKLIDNSEIKLKKIKQDILNKLTKKALKLQNEGFNRTLQVYAMRIYDPNNIINQMFLARTPEEISYKKHPQPYPKRLYNELLRQSAQTNLNKTDKGFTLSIYNTKELTQNTPLVGTINGKEYPYFRARPDKGYWIYQEYGTKHLKNTDMNNITYQQTRLQTNQDNDGAIPPAKGITAGAHHIISNWVKKV